MHVQEKKLKFPIRNGKYWGGEVEDGSVQSYSFVYNEKFNEWSWRGCGSNCYGSEHDENINNKYAVRCFRGEKYSNRVTSPEESKLLMSKKKAERKAYWARVRARDARLKNYSGSSNTNNCTASEQCYTIVGKSSSTWGTPVKCRNGATNNIYYDKNSGKYYESGALVRHYGNSFREVANKSCGVY